MSKPKGRDVDIKPAPTGPLTRKTWGKPPKVTGHPTKGTK